MSIEGVEVGKTCRVYSRLTALNAVVKCPSPTGTTVMFQPETQSIRWTMDGSDPTASRGFLVTAGTVVCYTGDLSKVRFIEVGASATLNVAVFE